MCNKSRRPDSRFILIRVGVLLSIASFYRRSIPECLPNGHFRPKNLGFSPVNFRRNPRISREMIARRFSLALINYRW
jgi:hypothetical protein